MVVLAGNSSENLIASNHFLRDRDPWTPFECVDNGRDDLFGLLRISGHHNSVIGNHFSEVLHTADVRPPGATPVIIRLASGNGNHVANNHMVALDVRAPTGRSAFAAQVDALLTTDAPTPLAVTAVAVDPGSRQNTVLDSGRETEVVADRAVNAVRATPKSGA
jgi:inulin fructotransferase (DFA-I-forming)